VTEGGVTVAVAESSIFTGVFAGSLEVVTPLIFARHAIRRGYLCLTRCVTGVTALLAKPRPQ
jgi:hypothetical protein